MKNASEIAALLSEIRSKGSKRVVFVSGIFNVLHPGHLRLLKFAEEQGDILIVGVHSNALAPGAVMDERQRLESVAAVAYVDRAFLMMRKAEEVIADLRPEVVVKGREWMGCDNPEEKALKKYGGKLVFSSGEATFSSLDLIREEFKRREDFQLRPSVGYLKRHGITHQSLRNALTALDGLNVVVLGDTIVDEYIVCEALGMSQEDPVIVVRPFTSQKFIGGAGIVALHVRGLGARVQFCSVIGKDETAKFVKAGMAKSGVDVHFIEDATRPTTLKQRFVSQGKKLLRVSYLREQVISRDMLAQVAKLLPELLTDAHLVIFSDFNYGFISDELRERVAGRCRRRRVKMAADCQSSSQIGNVARFVGMDLATPTEREARLALHDRESGLVVLAHKLEQKMQAKNILVTLGGEGILVHKPVRNGYVTDRLPALNPNPKDVMGAGDSLLAGASMTLAAGYDIWTAAYVGSLCAAYQVACLGNQPLLKKDILGLLNKGVV